MEDVSEEGYGGQVVRVEWRRGQVSFGGRPPGTPGAAASHTGRELGQGRARRTSEWGLEPRPTNPRAPDELSYSQMNFGVVRRQTTNSPAFGAIFLGLVKERQSRVRPTLLEQTDVKSLRFDFGREGKP